MTGPKALPQSVDPVSAWPNCCSVTTILVKQQPWLAIYFSDTHHSVIYHSSWFESYLTHTQ